MLTKQMSRKHSSLTELTQAYQKTVQEISRRHTTNESVELELRVPSDQHTGQWMNIWRAAYLRVLERYHQAKSTWPVVVECTARIIERSNDKHVSRIFQTNYTGSQATTVGITKTVLVNSHVDGIKISLNREEIGDAAKYRHIQPSLVRLRIRIGFELPELPGWRLEFTYVAATTNKSVFQDFVTRTRKEFLPEGELTPENFLDYVRAGPNRSAEIELEYLPSPNKSAGPTEAAIRSAIQEFKQIVRPPKPGEKNYSTIIHWIAKLLGQSLTVKSTLKQISNNPISLGRAQFADIRPNIGEYYLTDKADGERGFLVICPVEKWPIREAVGSAEEQSDTDDELPDMDAEPSKRTIPAKKLSGTHVVCLLTSVATTIDITVKSKTPLGITILDLEYLHELDRPAKTLKPCMFVFDALMFDGVDITGKNLGERLEAAATAVSMLGERVAVKPQTHLRHDTYPTQIKAVYNAKRPYETDGLIFTHGPSTYWKRGSVFKWKPPERLTIDFLVMRAPESMMTSAPFHPRPGYVMYLLFSGISPSKMDQYGLTVLPCYRELFRDFQGGGQTVPIQFTTPTHKLAYVYYHPVGKKKVSKDLADDELHRHVGEFIWIPNDNTSPKPDLAPGMVPWQFVKLRADKEANMLDGIAYGNSYTTALSTFNDILHPLRMEELTNPEAVPVSLSGEKSADDEELGYFAKSKGKDYRPMTAYNNFVKAQVLQQLTGVNHVVDLMSGRGQDLLKYVGWGVKSLICVDKDAKALADLEARARHINDAKWYVYPPKPQNAGIRLSVLAYDLGKNLVKLPEMLIAERMLPDERADAVVCNLGLHYVIDSKKSLELFIKMLDATLKMGGMFIYTSLNGNTVHKMLQGLKKGETWTSGMGKYSIRKDYDAASMDYGLKVGVLHPFSNGEYYVENLLDMDTIKTELEAAGYWQVQYGNFLDFWHRYEQFNANIASRLQDADRFYSGLYQYSTFVRAV